MVDEKKIGMTPAVEISYLKPEEQQMLLTAIDSEQATPSLSQAQRMKKLSREGKLNDDSMLDIMMEQKKPEGYNVVLSADKLRKYFPRSYTPQRDGGNHPQAAGRMAAQAPAGAEQITEYTMTRPGRELSLPGFVISKGPNRRQTMYINTFKYRPEDVACVLCAEYVKKLGCTVLSCPCLAERMEAGVVGYAEAVAELFPLHPRLTPRILRLVAGFPGSLWQDEQHKRRFAYLRTLLGYRKKRDTPVFLAALYLLTSNKEIGDRSFNCFTKGGIDFRYARRRGISQHDYTLLMGAKSLYCGTDEVTKGDLAEPQIVGDEAFRLLINALLIARYGEDALRIASQQGQREFIKRRAFRRGGFLPSAPLTGR